jgi:mono/diheme cytochrome c family protein
MAGFAPVTRITWQRHDLHAAMTSLRLPLFCTAVTLALASCSRTIEVANAETPAEPSQAASDDALLARGEYLVRIAGCNDCHTPGYAESGGQVPEAQWLVGTPLGWHGPWGTTYAANLRLTLDGMDEATWLTYSGGLHTRPPMPDFAVRAMDDNDRRAIYRFIRSLGPAGRPAPAYLPPGTKPKVPYVQWVLPPGAPAGAPTG